MNYQSPYQDPLNSMNYQFQNMGFGGVMNNGAGVNGLGGVGQPLSRTTSSLADSIGIQRASSPFVSQSPIPGQVSGGLQQPLESNNGISGGVRGVGQVNANSLANGWSQSASASAVGSPYIGQLNQATLYNSGSPHLQNLSMPPGMAPPQPVVVKSQWKYVDTQGQIQGPFDSTSMSQWYASGYFQPSLQISRQGNTPEPFGINDRFILLAELISRVNDFHDPFSALDKIISSTTQVSPLNVPVSAVQLSKQEVDDSSTPVARVESRDFTHDEILDLKDPDGGFYHEVLVQIPSSRKNKQKLDPNVEVNTSSTTSHNGIIEIPRKESVEEKTQKLQQENASSIDKGCPQKEVLSGTSKTTDTLMTTELADQAEMLTVLRQQKADEMAKKLLEEQERQEDDMRRKEAARQQKKQQKQKAKEPNNPPAKSKANADSVAKNISVPVQEPAKETPTPVNTPMAPWANKVKNTETPKISIPELQRREEIELMKKNQEREMRERAAALKLQEQILQQEKADNELKSKLTWANKPAPATIPINIKAQKKESETDLQKTKSTTKNSSGDPLNELNDPSFIKQQQKLWEDAQRSKSSTTSMKIASSNKAWTTVTSKSSNNVSRETKITNQPKSYISPDKLRAASVTTARQIGSSTSIPSLKPKYPTPVSYPGNSSVAVRQDFLKWCKSQMKLNPNVSSISVLEVLLSLPAGPEAKEIIADTIYSNSSTMDGRRFAIEFIKRRIECEKQIKDPLTWTEALALPEGEEDDWEFQVVSKKKGRRH